MLTSVMQNIRTTRKIHEETDPITRSVYGQKDSFVILETFNSQTDRTIALGALWGEECQRWLYFITVRVCLLDVRTRHLLDEKLVGARSAEI